MSQHQILWADDEIDLLKPHILFLKSKGYDPVTVNNGRDALELVKERHFDLVILDENMPGLSGLETLQRIKEIAPQTQVIMITKSEEENIMNQAVGNNIADYLIKPVNPMQIMMSIKKLLSRDKLVSETVAAETMKAGSSARTLPARTGARYLAPTSSAPPCSRCSTMAKRCSSSSSTISASTSGRASSPCWPTISRLTNSFTPLSSPPPPSMPETPYSRA